ncbi:MAG: hypothetical protein QM763_01125 [Agriterribacter sp.]
MKSIITTLFLCACYFFLQAQSSSKIDRSNYYKVIASENLESINAQIELVKNSSEKYKEAFEGALMMKRAGLLKGASNKLKEFKAGRQKLEAVLDKNKDDAELRFLRLIIQENAPKILGFHKELEEDHKYIVANYKTMPEATQQVIRDYSKSSKSLSPSEF